MNILLLVLIILQAIDLVTTLYGLKKGATEYNPFLKLVFKNVDPAIALILLKVGLCYAALHFSDPYSTGVLCLAYIFLIINNVKVIYEQK